MCRPIARYPTYKAFVESNIKAPFTRPNSFSFTQKADVCRFYIVCKIIEIERVIVGDL